MKRLTYAVAMAYDDKELPSGFADFLEDVSTKIDIILYASTPVQPVRMDRELVSKILKAAIKMPKSV